MSNLVKRYTNYLWSKFQEFRRCLSVILPTFYCEYTPSTFSCPNCPNCPMEKIFSEKLRHNVFYLELNFYEFLVRLSALFWGMYQCVLLLPKLPKLRNLNFLSQTWYNLMRTIIGVSFNKFEDD